MAFYDDLDWLVRVRGRKEKAKIDYPVLGAYLEAVKRGIMIYPGW